MKFRIEVIVILFIIIISSNSHAENSRFYVGGSAGHLNYHHNISASRLGLLSKLPTSTLLSESFEIKAEDLGWKIYTGLNINRYLAIEIDYSDIGKLDVNGNITQQNDTEIFQVTFGTNFTQTRDIKGFTISGIVKYPFSENLDVFAKFGTIYWDADITWETIVKPVDVIFTENISNHPEYTVQDINTIYDATIYSTITSVTPLFYINESGNDVIFGLGANYKFKNNLGVRVEWERLRNLVFGNKDIDFFNLGLNYNFDLF